MADDTSTPSVDPVPSVPEGLFTQEQLDAAVAQAKSGLADLESQIADLTAAGQKAVQERDSALAQLSKSADELLDLKDELTQAEADLKVAKSAPAVVGLVLGGVPHVVVRQERMRDMAEAFKARFIDDDDTVLVVKKA